MDEQEAGMGGRAGSVRQEVRKEILHVFGSDKQVA